MQKQFPLFRTREELRDDLSHLCNGKCPLLGREMMRFYSLQELPLWRVRKQDDVADMAVSVSFPLVVHEMKHPLRFRIYTTLYGNYHLIEEKIRGANTIQAYVGLGARWI